MRALRSELSTAASEAAASSYCFQCHDTPMPKSVVTPRRSVRRANGHEKNVYASVGRQRVTPLLNEASDTPNPYEGFPYNWCHSWPPSVWRPTSIVRFGPQLIESPGIETNGLFETICAAVTPVRRNHGFPLSRPCAWLTVGHRHHIQTTSRIQFTPPRTSREAPETAANGRTRTHSETGRSRRRVHVSTACRCSVTECCHRPGRGSG